MKATQLLIELIGEDNAMDVIQALEQHGKFVALSRIRLHTSIEIAAANGLFDGIKLEWGLNKIKTKQ